MEAMSGLPHEVFAEFPDGIPVSYIHHAGDVQAGFLLKYVKV
jgi:hypothetical protein